MSSFANEKLKSAGGHEEDFNSKQNVIYNEDVDLHEKKRQSANKRNALVLLISLVIDLLAFTVILPLLPSLLDYYHARGDIDVGVVKQWVRLGDNDKWDSVLFGGFIGAIFSLLQFLSSPIIGALSDVHGRKPLIICTYIGIASSYLIWTLSYSFPVFVLSRVVGGISKGNISLSTVVVGDLTSPKDRSKGMALIGIAFAVGFLIGPLVGAWFASGSKNIEYFFISPAIYSLVLSVINILFVATFFKETLPSDKRFSSIDYSNIKSLVHPFHLFNFTSISSTSPSSSEEKAQMRRLNLGYFLFLFLYSGLEFTLTFLTHVTFNYSRMQQGKMFLLIGILMITFHGTVLRRVAKGNELKTASRGIVILALSYVIIAISSSLASQLIFYFGILLFSYSSSVVVPCLTSLMSMKGRDDQKGKLMGIFRSSGSLARAIGPFMASLLYWSVGAQASYLLAACLLVLPYVLLSTLKPHRH